MQDDSIFEKVLRVENKDLFIDLKTNQGGTYLKISERKNGNRNSIMIPASGIERFAEALQELTAAHHFEAATQRNKGVSPLRQESDEDVERKSRSIYVGNLSWECDEDQLKEWCSGAGVVVNAVVLRRGKRSTGSGLVEFTDVASAQNAVATLNGTEMDGRNIVVREDRVAGSQQEKKERKPRYSDMPASEKVIEPNKVFVQNLTWETTEEELVAAFCPIADVTSVEIRQSRSGRSLGCGVVEFNSPQGAQDAIATLNGEDLNGREMLIREYYQ